MVKWNTWRMMLYDVTTYVMRNFRHISIGIVVLLDCVGQDVSCVLWEEEGVSLGLGRACTASSLADGGKTSWGLQLRTRSDFCRRHCRCGRTWHLSCRRCVCCCVIKRHVTSFLTYLYQTIENVWHIFPNEPLKQVWELRKSEWAPVASVTMSCMRRSQSSISVWNAALSFAINFSKSTGSDCDLQPEAWASENIWREIA